MSAYDRINKRFAKTSGQTLGQRADYWKKEHEKITKELEAHKAQMEKQKQQFNKEETIGMVGGTPVNNVGDGNIAGLGVGPQGEPGVNKKKKKQVVPFKMFTRRKPQ
jgi:hypothetical protein